MHLKHLAILSLTTLTLASPIAQDAQDAPATASAIANPSAIAIPIVSVPTSILTVLETAVPASWYAEMLNSASRDSIASEIAAGTLPAWYNSLPASVKAWATSAGSDIAQALIGATPTAAAAAAGTTAANGSAGNGNDATHAVTATPGPTALTSGPKAQTTKTSSGSSASETASSTSKSSAPSSSTSTGGAPIATGSIAMSFAGAAGLLGLALAL